MSAPKKFELIADQSITVFGRTLFRIRALISFGVVKAGEVGGYVEKESNVSHDGDAWVSGNAQVCGNALVSGDAWVCGNAQVCGNAALTWISRVGSECGTLTAFTARAGITVTRGCFLGTLVEFEAAVKARHGESQIAAEYSLLVQFIRLRLGAAQERLAKEQEAA